MFYSARPEIQRRNREIPNLQFVFDLYISFLQCYSIRHRHYCLRRCKGKHNKINQKLLLYTSFSQTTDYKRDTKKKCTFFVFAFIKNPSFINVLSKLINDNLSVGIAETKTG